MDDNELLPIDLLRVSHRFRKLHTMDAFDEMSKGAFFMLEVLHRHQKAHPESEGMYASDLAAHMRMSPPGVSRSLKPLEAAGYIRRSVDLEDRRNTYIALTDEGEAIRKRKKQEVLSFVKQVFEKMGEDNMRQLITLWNLLADTMEAVNAEKKIQNEKESPCSES